MLMHLSVVVSPLPFPTTWMPGDLRHSMASAASLMDGTGTSGYCVLHKSINTHIRQYGSTLCKSKLHVKIYELD